MHKFHVGQTVIINPAIDEDQSIIGLVTGCFNLYDTLHGADSTESMFQVACRDSDKTCYGYMVDWGNTCINPWSEIELEAV